MTQAVAQRVKLLDELQSAMASIPEHEVTCAEVQALVSLVQLIKVRVDRDKAEDRPPAPIVKLLPRRI